MNISIQQAASAIKAYEQWHENIARNLSGATIPGFKSNRFTMESIPAPSSKQGQNAMGQPDSILQSYEMPKGLNKLDFSAGPLKKTELATDMALGGPVKTEGDDRTLHPFFAVELPESGEVGYTRDGEFHLKEVGNEVRLVTKQGHYVLGETGPISFEETTGFDFTISRIGLISENGNDSQQAVKVVGFENPEFLENIGVGIFKPTDPLTAEDLDAENIDIQQFHLEQSNVSSIQEMTRMIQAMRSNEVNHRVIHHYDQRLGKTIADLGTPI